MTMKLNVRIARVIATWFGCGYWPWGPGTVGAAAAVLIAVLLGWSAWHCAIAAVILLPVSVWAAGTEAVRSGRKDPGHIVVDEVIGQWIALAGARVLDWRSCLFAFLLFRLFDIWKPAPVRQLENLKGGAGIVADDAMAGIYGALVLCVAGLLNLY